MTDQLENVQRYFNPHVYYRCKLEYKHDYLDRLVNHKELVHHTCQLLRISRKLYGFFVILRAYGRRGISLRIFLFTKSLFFLRLICTHLVRKCPTSTLNQCAKPYNLDS